MNWTSYPLLRLALFMTLGIMAAEASVPHVSSMTLFVACAAALACASWLMVRCKVSAGSKSGAYAFGISAMVMAFLLGMFMYTARYERMAHCVISDTEPFEGIVKDVPQEKRKSWMVRLSGARRYDVVLYVGKDMARYEEQKRMMLSVEEGDTIAAIGRHVRSTISDDAFSKGYLRMLLHTGVCATAYVRPRDLRMAPCDGSITWSSVSARLLQKRLHEVYVGNNISGEAGDVIEAVSIGRKKGLPSSLRESYAKAGVSHMLALSGFHVGVIMVLLQWVLMSRFVSRRKGQAINLFALLLLWAFVFVAGASASLVRAALMCSVAMLNAICGRTCNFFNVCTLAYVAMLCVNAMSLYDISFQLSYLAVAGIAIYNALMRDHVPSMPWLLRFVYDTVAICIVCTLFTAPMAAYHFGSVSLVCLASNLAAVPLLYVIMAGIFLWWLTLCCAPLNAMATSLVTWAASALNGVVDRMSSLPFASVAWHPGICATLCSYALLVVMVYVANALLQRRGAAWA